jgi:hypothetical protein
VCLETKGNDAGRVGLVDRSELFGHLGLGDRRSQRVKDIDDELTAGEEAVRGEFSGTECDGGRVILAVREKKKKRKKRIRVSAFVCFVRSKEKAAKLKPR